MTPLPRFDHYRRATLLARLSRLVRLRNVYVADLNEAGTRLLDVCIEATRDDCAEEGAVGMAESIIEAGERTMG